MSRLHYFLPVVYEQNFKHRARHFVTRVIVLLQLNVLAYIHLTIPLSTPLGLFTVTLKLLEKIN
jgi:hypothetical protein